MTDQSNPDVLETSRPEWLHSAMTMGEDGIARASFKTTITDGEIWFDTEPVLRVVVQDDHGRHVFRLTQAQAEKLGELLTVASWCLEDMALSNAKPPAKGKRA